MVVFLTTCLLLAVSLFLHLLLWKVRLPKRQYRALFIIFVAVLGSWLVWAVLRSTPLCELLSIVLFHASISFAYMVVYASIEGDSPTLSLVRFIAEKLAAGRREDELRQCLGRRPFARSRLQALVASGLVREQEGRFVVAGKGSLGFRCILAFRKLYGPVSKGG